MTTRGDVAKPTAEIEFASGSVVPAPQASADRAVTTAFIAFHRNARANVPIMPRGRSISRGGLAVTILAVLGFGGGLLLALLSFNSPDAGSRPLAGRAPEMLYTGPAHTPPAANNGGAPVVASGESGFFAAAPLELRQQLQPLADRFPWGYEAASESVRSFTATNLGGDAPAFADTAVAIAGSAPGSELASSGVATDLAALTAAPAPVPEPSTWITLLSGAGLFLVGKLKRQR